MSFDPETLKGLKNFNDDIYFNRDVTFYGRVNLDKVVISGDSVSFSKNIEFTGGDISVNKLNATSIDAQNINAGISTFQDIYINGKLYDGDGDFGTAGQVLSSDGTNLDWINTSSANVGSASNVGTNENATNADQYVTFVAAKTGNNPIRVDDGIRYNPSTNVLTVGALSLSGASSGGVIPSGGIIMWSGAINAIPSGWVLCNGQNNTPDLRDRFVVGAGNAYSVDETGGSNDAIVVEHNHTATTTTSTSISPSSVLSATSGTTILAGAPSGTLLNYYAATSASSSSSTTVNNQGSSGVGANRPPYYALAYIMKS